MATIIKHKQNKNKRLEKTKIETIDSPSTESMSFVEKKTIDSLVSILECGLKYITPFFITAYSDLPNAIINHNEYANDFFNKVDEYYSLCSYPSLNHKSYRPLSYIYELFKKAKTDLNNIIVSLQGYNGTGKSKFCEALYFYMLYHYSEHNCIPFIFNTDSCYEKISSLDNKILWSKIKEEFLKLVEIIKIQLQNQKDVILILDGIYDPIEIPYDIVIKCIEQEIRQLIKDKHFYVIISEDMEDYFAKSSADERDWLEAEQYIYFEGCRKKDNESLKQFITAYCALFKINEAETLTDRVSKAYPIFRIDSNFLYKICTANIKMFDIARHYYENIFCLNNSASNINLIHLTEVALDIFIDGQINDSWRPDNTSELMLLLNDEYAFYFFIGYIFLEKWKQCEDINKIHEDTDFISMIGNRNLCFLDRRIIFFISFLFSHLSVNMQEQLLSKVEYYIRNFYCNYKKLLPSEKVNYLKAINNFIFIISKFNFIYEDNRKGRLLNKCLEIQDACCEVTGVFQSPILFDIWSTDDNLNNDICRYFHYLYLFSIATNFGNSDNVFKEYIFRIRYEDNIFKRIIRSLKQDFISYWGIKHGVHKSLIHVLYEIEYEIINRHMGVFAEQNELNLLILTKLIYELGDDKNSFFELCNTLKYVLAGGFTLSDITKNYFSEIIANGENFNV